MTDNITCWQEYGATRPTVHWEGVNTVATFWKTVGITLQH